MQVHLGDHFSGSGTIKKKKDTYYRGLVGPKLKIRKHVLGQRFFAHFNFTPGWSQIFTFDIWCCLSSERSSMNTIRFRLTNVFRKVQKLSNEVPAQNFQMRHFPCFPANVLRANALWRKPPAVLARLTAGQGPLRWLYL